MAGDVTIADVAAAGRHVMRWRLRRLADAGVRLVDNSWQCPERRDADPFVVHQVALAIQARERAVGLL